MNSSDQPRPGPEGPDDPRRQPQGQGEQVRASHLSARVPESVSRGVFSTGAIVMTGPSEFVLDFIQHIGRPHQVAARVVVPHSAMPQFIKALRKNLDIYTERFGPLPELPRPQSGRRPSIREIYDDLKLPDDVLSGVYANGVMIGHTPAEFNLDFLTNFFPQSAVSCRVFLSAAQVSRLLETLTHTYEQFQRRLQQRREAQEADDEPPPPDAPNGEPEDPPAAADD